MQEPYIGEIALYPYNFVPKYWAPCNGQLLPIQQYTALFALIGTNYGGDGRTNFALPNLQSATPVGAGQGPGLSDIEIGQSGGQVNVSLTTQQMPIHGHALAGVSSADGPSPVTKAIAVASDPNGEAVYAYGPADGTMMNPATARPEGGGMPFNNRPPYLGLEWCIALQGVFPPRQ